MKQGNNNLQSSSDEGNGREEGFWMGVVVVLEEKESDFEQRNECRNFAISVSDC
jgi:hypothetical protein